MISIPLYLTTAHECSYLDDQSAQSVYVHPSCSLTNDLYAQLIEQGFRRSGDEVYRPQCGQCSACIPVRLAVEQFKPNRRQKRCLIKNRHIKVEVKPAAFEWAHYELYIHYQMIRHGSGDMAKASPEEYLSFLGSAWCDTKFVEFSIDNELAGVAVVDQFENALSAVYTFFNPKFASASLGVYAVLWQIEQARSLQKDFLYLGYWIKACQKMSYKSDYQPLQVLVDGQWRDER
jgi:arginine-tRNA-protein transferase